MARAALILLLGMLFCGGVNSRAQGQSGERQEILFRVQVSGTGLQAHWKEEGKQSQEYVEARLPGTLYDPPRRYVPIVRQDSKRDTPVDAAISDFSAFKADEEDWIVENFAPAERDNIRQFLGNASVREQNSKIFQNRGELVVTGVVYHGEYALVFTGSDDGSPVRPVAWKKAGGGSEWLRTNELSGNTTYDIVFSALANGEVRIAE